MQVRQGWSGEVKPSQWAKFDLSLDEGDLRRLMRSADIEFVDPADVPVELAFQLLEVEAEHLVLAKLITRYGMDTNAGQAMSSLDKTKAAILAKIRALGE